MLETIESAGDEEDAETCSSSSGEEFEYSDDEFLYGSINCKFIWVFALDLVYIFKL